MRRICPAALIEVLSGREVQTQITHDSQGPVFTVAVPWIQDDTVLGAVFIHTSSQIIEAEYHGLCCRLALGFAFGPRLPPSSARRFIPVAS